MILIKKVGYYISLSLHKIIYIIIYKKYYIYIIINYYNKYLKYKNKYLNFIIKGGNGIQLSFKNSIQFLVTFNHPDVCIIRNKLYFTTITYNNNTKKYNYFYFFDETNNGVIFSYHFSKCFKLFLQNNKQIRNINIPKYIDNNIFDINKNNYIIYYYYNNNNTIKTNILDKTKINDNDLFIKKFFFINKSFNIDIHYNKQNIVTYNILNKEFNKKIYRFIKNKSDNKWKYFTPLEI